MNDCKTNRRIKRRNMDERTKYSALLHGLGFDSVRRTVRVLIHPAVRRENTKTVRFSDDFSVIDLAGEDQKLRWETER